MFVPLVEAGETAFTAAQMNLIGGAMGVLGLVLVGGWWYYLYR
ncbi:MULTISPECIES: hypothetical protein [unclassified Haladaptatus]|nr:MULTISPECIES: hypothetical protein [unclassified Haladaptatus]